MTTFSEINRCTKSNLSLRQDRPSPDEEDEFMAVVEFLWQNAEEHLLCLLQDDQVHPTDLKIKDLDENSMKDAIKCIDEVDRFLVTRNYAQALSLLRGSRQFFKNSLRPSIKNLFWDMEELEKLKDIYVVLRLVTHLGMARTLSVIDLGE